MEVLDDLVLRRVEGPPPRVDALEGRLLSLALGGTRELPAHRTSSRETFFTSGDCLLSRPRGSLSARDRLIRDPGLGVNDVLDHPRGPVSPRSEGPLTSP